MVGWFSSGRGLVQGLILCCLMSLFLMACRSEKGGGQTADKPPAASVTVVTAEQKTVPVWIEHVGITSAVREVDIRARVEGFLQSRSFVEGGMVSQGQTLYTIEPDQYRVNLKKALAQLERDKAALVYARSQVKRYEPLAAGDFASPETLEDYRTQEKEAAAAVQASEAAVDDARITLGYCTITSPIAGRIGKTVYNEGNLVGQSGQDTVLTNVVQLDPVYVNFSPSEKEFQAVMAYKKEGPLQIEAGLASVDKGFPFKGQVEYIANEVDQATGTVPMRATVPNAEAELLPGMYVKVRLYMNDIPGLVLIPQQALAEDQGGRYVLVADDQGRVVQTRVRTQFNYQGLAVVEKGLKGGEQVIVEGQQKVRPGMQVKAQSKPMSRFQGEAGQSVNATAAPAKAEGAGNQTASGNHG